MHCFCIVALGKYFKSITCFFLCMTRTALRNIVSFYFNQHLISEQVCWKIVVPCRVNASKLLLTVFCTKKLNTFGENHFGKKLCSFSVYDLFSIFSLAEFIYPANIMSWMCILESLLEEWATLQKFSLETKRISEDAWKVFTSTV